MNRRTFLLAAAALPLAPAAAREPRRVEHVVLISLDGGKPSVMQESHMPLLSRMRRDGAFTWEARTVTPSITLVSHTSMLTGVQPAKHQVTWNDWEPARGVVQVPTLFALAKAQKKTTALFAGKEKFAHLYQPGTLDSFAIPDYHARLVARAAAECLRESKPNLCFIHFADSDGAGHRYGWGSAEQKQAFADEDRALGTVMDALRRARIADRTVVIVSADHGGHAKTHGSESPEDMQIPWIAWGAGVRRGFAITEPVSTCDTAATALALLGIPIPPAFDGKPVASAFEPGVLG